MVQYSQSMCSVDCAITNMIDKCGCVAEELKNHLGELSFRI